MIFHQRSKEKKNFYRVSCYLFLCFSCLEGLYVSQKVYVSLTGRYPWATINSYYAVIYHERFIPERIIVVCEDDYKSTLPLVHQSIQCINDSFAVECSMEEVIMPTADFSLCIHQFHQLIKQFVENKDSVALDITGGRRTLIASSLLSMKQRIASHVFYLAVTEEGKKDVPFLLKPLKSMQVKDFLEAVKNE